MENYLPKLQALQNYFKTGATRSYQFRRAQLKKLKEAILLHEKELHDALYADLRKSPEESWVTETGFLVAEINHALRKLEKWMAPERVGTNLLNFPAKSSIYKEPLGTVLIIGPWNYPLQLLFTPLVGAIAAGNCVVVKPSEVAPATASAMKKIIDEHFPPGYILSIEGEGRTVIPHLLENFRFDHIFYTGNGHVGKQVYEMAAKQLTPVTLELGGKSPCVVEDDANMKVTARRIAVTKFSNAGQMCVAPDYVLVHQSKKDELINRLQQTIREFFTHDPSSSYNYGKMINERHFHRVVSYMHQGRIVFGGKHDAATHFIEPTLLEDVPLNTVVMGEEIFGPVLPIIPFSNFEEAKSIIQRNPNPLAFYVFTSSASKEKKWLEEISFGGGCVNNASWHLTNYNLPFGGRGHSGFGSYHGKYSFDTFSHHKAVMKTPTWFDPNIKYPPFKGKLNFFKKIIR